MLCGGAFCQYIIDVHSTGTVPSDSPATTVVLSGLFGSPVQSGILRSSLDSDESCVFYHYVYTPFCCCCCQSLRSRKKLTPEHTIDKLVRGTQEFVFGLYLSLHSHRLPADPCRTCASIFLAFDAL